MFVCPVLCLADYMFGLFRIRDQCCARISGSAFSSPLMYGLWFVLLVVKFDVDLNGIVMLHHGVVFLVFN